MITPVPNLDLSALEEFGILARLRHLKGGLIERKETRDGIIQDDEAFDERC